MPKKKTRQQSLQEQALVNREKLEKEIEVCKLQEQFGNTEAARIMTEEHGRPMGGTTVRQIYVTYQVFQASKVIQKLFYSGLISWSDFYGSRKIYTRGHIREEFLAKLEDGLLEKARRLGKEHESPIKTRGVINQGSLDEYYRILDKKVSQSKNNHSERLFRLKTAHKFPKVLELTHTVFDRNPDVIAEVLEKANGFCERCKQVAPFIRKSDGTPFLEVHHLIPLAQGGEDTVENAIALCPNCHREMHYGILD